MARNVLNPEKIISTSRKIMSFEHGTRHLRSPGGTEDINFVDDGFDKIFLKASVF